MAADDLGSMVGYMSDGEMLTINAPKDSVSVYWDNNLKIPNSFGEITVVTFPPCQDSELRLFFLYFGNRLSTFSEHRKRRAAAPWRLRMSSIASPAGHAPPDSPTTELTLAEIGWDMRLRLHLIAAVAVVFLTIYGRVVCPFVDSVELPRLIGGLCIVGLAQACLREALYGAFARPWGNTSLARHGMLIAVLSWVLAGLIAMALHMFMYPSFPMGSHVKLLTGYWALGGGILSQLEFNMLERYLRGRLGARATTAQSVEHITSRLMESYAVFTIVPALIMVLAAFRQVHEGYGGVAEALEITFVGAVFVTAALIVAWRYGAALREDCRSIRDALDDVGAGQFRVALDASRADELGLVARGISAMGDGLVRREQRESKLLEITGAFSEQLHVDRLLTVITTGATELLGAERSSLYLYDANRDQLCTQVAEGLDNSIIYLDKSAGLAGACFTQQEVINLADVRQDQRFNAELDRKTGFNTRNMLCMPVTTRAGKHLGVIQVLNRRDGTFDERDELRLYSVSAQAATALENARLFEDVLNLKNYDESILKSLSNGVISVDPDLRLTKVNAAAERVLGWSEQAIVGQNLQDLFADKNSWLAEAAAAVRESRQAEHALDVDIATDADTNVSVNVSVVPLIDVADQFIGLLLIIEDLSAEKRVRSTMSRYMPKAVVDQVLANEREVLEGHAQTMTLLFTDIRSFTSISEAIGPRATVIMLNEYFSDMVDILDANGGILDKYIGDAIMALFGVPFTGTHDERSAVDAANGMMLALEQLNEGRAHVKLAPLMHGIGVNTGEAVAGNIGSPKRMDYTVIGDAVNLTARIESITKFYGTPVLLSDMTFARLDSPEHIREIDRIRVKGKTEPVTLYESYAYRADHLDAKTIDSYGHQTQALKYYRAQQWQPARQLFEQCTKLIPDDKVAEMYLSRIEHYELHSPGTEWDGVWTMQSK